MSKIIYDLPEYINITVNRKFFVDFLNCCPPQNQGEQALIFQKFFSFQELSEYTGYSVTAILKMVADDEIPYYKITDKFLFRKFDIDEWLLTRKQPIINECIVAPKNGGNTL